jgi:hypothetical protein
LLVNLHLPRQDHLPYQWNHDSVSVECVSASLFSS